MDSREREKRMRNRMKKREILTDAQKKPEKQLEQHNSRNRSDFALQRSTEKMETWRNNLLLSPDTPIKGERGSFRIWRKCRTNSSFAVVSPDFECYGCCCHLRLLALKSWSTRWCEASRRHMDSGHLPFIPLRMGISFVYTSEISEEQYADREYNAQIFESQLPKSHHLIMFYAPWCGFCKRFNPTWVKLAQTLSSEMEVIAAKVDCTVETALCSEHDVTGYPTVKFYAMGSSEGIKFRGSRDMTSLLSFVDEQLGRSTILNRAPITTNGLTELTEYFFHDYVSTGNFFVKFYAPWCGHCQKLAPIWENLAKSLETDANVVIGRLDCTVHTFICTLYEIKGYPTLLWIRDGNAIKKYQGPRTEADMRAFVDHMLGRAEKPKVEEEDVSQGGVLVLNADNFQKRISEGISFVKFFAPWCGHCKRLAPIWNELNKKIADLPSVRLVKVDCTKEDSKELCNEQEVEGFPTLYLYKYGEKIAEYSGSRNVDDLYDYLSKQFTNHDEL